MGPCLTKDGCPWRGAIRNGQREAMDQQMMEGQSKLLRGGGY